MLGFTSQEPRTGQHLWSTQPHIMATVLHKLPKPLVPNGTGTGMPPYLAPSVTSMPQTPGSDSLMSLPCVVSSAGFVSQTMDNSEAWLRIALCGPSLEDREERHGTGMEHTAP